MDLKLCWVSEPSGELGKYPNSQAPSYLNKPGLIGLSLGGAKGYELGIEIAGILIATQTWK